MAIKIQIRRGTASEWTTANPVLSSGEPAHETDTGKFKIGDGTKDWNTLEYQGGGELSILPYVVIDGYMVKKVTGYTTTTDFEIGDRFNGWADNERYITGIVIGLPFDIDDNTKVKLATDNTI